VFAQENRKKPGEMRTRERYVFLPTTCTENHQLSSKCMHGLSIYCLFAHVCSSRGHSRGRSYDRRYSPSPRARPSYRGRSYSRYDCSSFASSLILLVKFLHSRDPNGTPNLFATVTGLPLLGTQGAGSERSLTHVHLLTADQGAQRLLMGVTEGLREERGPSLLANEVAVAMFRGQNCGGDD
jgi:hypothetical protein